MLSKIKSLTVWGIEGYFVDVEVDMSSGLPGISVVGLPDQAVKESKDRIRPAIKNSGFGFPSNRKTVINLAPADTKKEGPYFDLPIAIGILAASKNLHPDSTKDFVFVGELALDGSLRPVKGILPMAIKLAEDGTTKKLILPAGNSNEASIIKEIDVFPVNNLVECVKFLKGEIVIEKALSDTEAVFHYERKINVSDFREVKGQAYAKRAIEIAVSGGHNILMVGAPGAGKTMLASRIPSILPALTLKEALEITKIHSVAENIKDGIITERPYRNPHHTTSGIALIGGGSVPKPGEVSLAHNGVLFLDELPEFRKDVLEVLRQPLEEGMVSISRARGKISFPSRFLLAGSMNPCPCGWYGDSTKQCNCTLGQMLKYRKKISGPLMDRIDIHIEVPSLPVDLLMKDREEEPSSEIRKRVEYAREIQSRRFAGASILFNAHMDTSMVKKHCALDSECRQIARAALDAMQFSARAYDKIRKVARTIADMEGAAEIKAHHFAEAIQYRSIDRNFG